MGAYQTVQGSTPHAANETPNVSTHFQQWLVWPPSRAVSRRYVILLHIICAALWKSSVCHERNADRLDFQLITNCYRLGTLQNTASLSHVSGWSWNATPFWQPKFPPSNGVHSVDALVLYGNTIYSVRGILFNCINPDRIAPINYLSHFTLIKSSPISDMRPISEGLIKRKVFAGAHTI